MPGECAVCRQPAANSCGGCKVIFYCGKDHQKQHWKESHKGNCAPAYKIENNDKVGRCMVASRDIKKGELIFHEPPLVIGPKPYTFPVCLGCNQVCDKEKYHECDGCGFPVCRPQCQVSDLHYDECRLMMDSKYRVEIDLKQEVKKEVAYYNIVPIRCFLLQKQNPERFKKIMNLQSHIEDRAGTPLHAIYKRQMASLRALIGEAFDETLMMNIIGILDTNCFEMRRNNIKIRGLFSLASMLEHDCTPNTRHVFIGDSWTIGLYATVPIKKGQHITATYTHSFWGTVARRQHLKLVKCFDCSCNRCSDPEELGTYMGAIRCISCATVENYADGPKITALDPLDNNTSWKCGTCGRTVHGKQMDAGNKVLQEEVAKIDKSTPKGLEFFLEKYGADSVGVLHPTNTHVVQVKYALVQMYGSTKGFTYSDLSDEQLQKKADYCHDLLELIDVIDPGYTRLRGVLLNELQTVMIIQAKRDFNSDKATKQDVQKTLENAIVLLGEAIDILKIEPGMEEELLEKLAKLNDELDT